MFLLQGRLLVHIADAPCHGSQFNAGLRDDYPEGDKHGRSARELLRRLQRDCHVSAYLFCHLNGHTKQMLREFRRLTDDAATASQGPGEKGSWIQEESFSNLHSFMEKVNTVAKTTISSTLSTVAKGGAAPKFIPERVVTEKPDWDLVRRVRVQQLDQK
jgi:hypothetical protein